MAEMGEGVKKAFDFAAEAAKQLITVSTAVIAFSAVLLTDFIDEPTTWQKWLFALALLAYLVCIGLGLLAMFAMAGELEVPESDQGTTPQTQQSGAQGGAPAAAPVTATATVPMPSIYHGKIREYLLWQMIVFAAATLLIVAFGITAAFSVGTVTDDADPTATPSATTGETGNSVSIAVVTTEPTSTTMALHTTPRAATPDGTVINPVSTP
jgi:hypothetical protein